MNFILTYYKKNFLSLPVLFFIIVSLCPGNLFSQENFITDSLNNLLRKSRNKTDILIELAAEYQYVSPSKALQTASEALETARKEKNSTGEAWACFHIASNYMSIGQYDTCLKMLDRAETIFQRANNSEGLLNVGNARANLAYLQGNYDNALKQFENNLQKSTTKNLIRIQISSLTNIGRINWLRNNPEKALRYYNEALQKSDSANIPFMKGMLNLLAGIVYQDMGYYEMAASKILNSIEIFEQMNYLSRLPYAYNYMGSVCFEMQDNEKAVEYLRKANKGLSQTGDYWGQSIAHRFMGRAFRRLKMQDSAEYYFRNSLKLARELNDRSGEMSSLRFLGEVLLDQGKTDSAGLLLYESLNKSIASKNIRERINILYDLGILNKQKGKYNQALSLLNDAVSLSDSLELFYESMLLNKQLAETYESMGDYRNAVKFFKTYKSLNDSIVSSEKNKNLNELQLKYETEKKNSEISSLRMQQRIQEARLKSQKILGYSLSATLILVTAITILLWHNYKLKKKANSEKEILLKEIHHRVKNNLQTISSLLSLQSYNIDDSNIKEAFRESQERVKSIALIHQMLYQQEKLSEIDFGQYLQRLTDSVSAVFINPYSNISCSIDCDQTRIDIDTAIPLGLIANELIVNAYKYAFKGKDKGEINISFRRNSKNRYLFKIQDNGVGIPDHFKTCRSETLGLKLVSLLVRQLRGSISISNSVGTEITITF